MIIEFFSEPTHNIHQVQPILVGLAVELLQLTHIDVVQHPLHPAVVLILAAVRYRTSSWKIDDFFSLGFGGTTRR